MDAPPLSGSFRGQIHAIVERHRRELLRMERAGASEMVRAYGEIWKRLSAEIERLVARYLEAAAANDEISPSWVFEFNRLTNLQRQGEAELRAFVDFAEERIVVAQREAVEAAARHLQEIITASADPGIHVRWDRLSVGAVEDLVGFTRDGSPLRALLDELGSDASRAVRDGLIQGLALGHNPRQVARAIRGELGGNLVRALKISRTECLPGDTLVDSAVIGAIYRRWYQGPMVQIVTKSGRKFAATPNHPMLTRRGWVAAGEIAVGDNLVGNHWKQDARSAGNHDVQAPPATLCEIFDALSAVGIAERRRGAKPDFHGDGMEGDIDILRPLRPLSIGTFFPLFKPVIDSFLPPSDRSRAPICQRCGRLLTIDEQPCLCIGSDWDALIAQPSSDGDTTYTKVLRYGGQRFASEIAGGYCQEINSELETAISPGLCISPRYGGVLGACTGDTGFSENTPYRSPISMKHGRDLPHREARSIELDNVIFVGLRTWCGHVYNLSTPYGYFTANGLYTGNTLRAYREATRRNYQANSNIIAGWRWLCAKQARTCPSCLAMDGTFHTNNEDQDDHPNGRCSMMPVLKGEENKPPQWETGATWLAKQSPEVQTKILGQAGAEAYRAGAVQLADYVGQKRSDEWGSTRYARSLRDILGKEGAEKWYVRGQQAEQRRRDLVSKLERIDLGSTVTEIRGARALGRLQYHFEKHGELLGVSTPEEYLDRLHAVLQRPELAHAALRHKNGDLMWYAMDMSTQEVVLYNATKKRLWSYYHEDLETFLRRSHVVRIVFRDGKWVPE